MNPTQTCKGLLAAAFVAALCAPPSSAGDGKETADQVQQALDSGRLDQLYTGQRSATRAVEPVAGAPGASPRLARSASAPGPDAIPQDVIDKCLAMKGGLFGAGSDEKKFFREMTAKLQSSAEGRQVLASVISGCHDGADAIDVEARDYKGTAILNSGGVEAISGLGGESTPDEKVRSFRFNRKLLDFKNREAALEIGAGTMGHELTHIALHSEFKAAAPAYADVLDYSLLDEQSARVKGYIVDYEIAGTNANGDTLEAKDLADNPQRFFDRMKLWDPVYAIALQQRELRDPIPAYRKRIDKLKEAADDLQKDLDSLPLRLQQVDHVQQQHADVLKARGWTDRAKLLRDRLAKLQETEPQDIKDFNDAVAQINQMIALLSGPRGPDILAKLKALSYDPNYAQMVAGLTLDIQKLQDEVKAKPLAVPTPDQTPLPLDDFLGLFEKLHGTRGGPPWQELNPDQAGPVDAPPK